MLRPKAILETVLYAEDLEATSTFYKTVLHLAPVHIDNRMCALRVSEENFLLLFKAGATKEAIPVPGGEIPPHDGDGPMHVAFSINPSDLSLWTQHLQANLVAVESTVNWPSGEASIYFRDPDGNLVELATPYLWVR